MEMDRPAASVTGRNPTAEEVVGAGSVAEEALYQEMRDRYIANTVSAYDRGKYGRQSGFDLQLWARVREELESKGIEVSANLTIFTSEAAALHATRLGEQCDLVFGGLGRRPGDL